MDTVDVVSGVGYGRDGGRFHDVYRVVTNLAVLGFNPARLISVHPGVEPDEVLANTGFPLQTSETSTTREPTAEERKLLDRLDPDRRREREVP